MIDIGAFDLSRDRTALFLDIDGTLLDIAARPDEVIVSASLVADLRSAFHAFGGALSLVSGRTIAEIDRLFAPLILPASGIHGSEFRPNRNGSVAVLAPRMPTLIRLAAHEIVKKYPGVLLEDKGTALAIHWRLAPEFGPGISRDIENLLAAQRNSQNLALLEGHCVLEIKAQGLDKGRAVERFLEIAPFAGRRPVFIGDDVTDQLAFAAAVQRGGMAFSVSRPMDGVSDWFESPAQVRAWLGQFSGRSRASAVA